MATKLKKFTIVIFKDRFYEGQRNEEGLPNYRNICIPIYAMDEEDAENIIYEMEPNWALVSVKKGWPSDDNWNDEGVIK